MRAMRIAVLGSGGVGGYFGGRLAATGTDVTFIARGGAHLDAMRRQGLHINSPSGTIHVPRVTATDDARSVGAVDVVFFTVKLYDTDSALAVLTPLIGPDTFVVPFQNGVDSVDVLTRAVGKAHVAGGTAYVAAAVTEPGVITHTAMERLMFGPVSGSVPPVLEELRQACLNAGVEATLSERILVDIWTKFVRLTVFSGMTSIARSPIGPIREDPELRDMMETALHESIAVARAKQIPVQSTIFDDVMTALMAVPPQAKSSMLVDLERGRRLELPWLSGAVVRIGEAVGVDVPTHRLIDSLLKPHVKGRELAA